MKSYSQCGQDLFVYYLNEGKPGKFLDLAQRLLPSIIMAMCRGKFSILIKSFLLMPLVREYGRKSNKKIADNGPEVNYRKAVKIMMPP
jgi:hypothetical protein